jgi:hypothetical protein
VQGNGFHRGVGQCRAAAADLFLRGSAEEVHVDPSEDRRPGLELIPWTG